MSPKPHPHSHLKRGLLLGLGFEEIDRSNEIRPNQTPIWRGLESRKSQGKPSFSARETGFALRMGLFNLAQSKPPFSARKLGFASWRKKGGEEEGVREGREGKGREGKGREGKEEGTGREGGREGGRERREQEPASFLS